MKKIIFLITLLNISYSCSPINKQHGYLLGDFLNASDTIDTFRLNTSSKNDVFSALGSPSIEISDINNVWIYLVSLKQKNIFEEDEMQFQTILRFEFNDNNLLISKNMSDLNNFTSIAFSEDKTKVRRNAYGITDQLYEAFTRGQ